MCVCVMAHVLHLRRNQDPIRPCAVRVCLCMCPTCVGPGARHHMTMCHSDSSPLKTPNHDIVLNERMKHILNDMLGLLG